MPCREGQSITWDVTIADTVTDSYLAATSITAGAAAEAAAERKTSKYTALMQHDLFAPVATETFGPICAESQSSFVTLASVSPSPRLIRVKQPSCFSGHFIAVYSGTMALCHRPRCSPWRKGVRLLMRPE
jgi:hypothetical protein